MPAVSEAQRRFLNARFGHAWVVKHGFDNPGKLPAHASKSSLKQAGAKAAARKRMRRHKKAKPNAKAPLGQGGRFAALEQKLAGKTGVTDPGALAAAIGRKKFGKKRFQKLAAKGR